MGQSRTGVRNLLLAPFLATAAWGWTVETSITQANATSTDVTIMYRVTTCVERADLEDLPESPPAVVLTNSLWDEDTISDDHIFTEGSVNVDVSDLVDDLKNHPGKSISCKSVSFTTTLPWNHVDASSGNENPVDRYMHTDASWANQGTASDDSPTVPTGQP